MSEQFLDSPQIGAPFKKVGGEGVAQGVGGDMKPNSALFGVFIDDSPHTAICEPAPLGVEEEGLSGVVRAPGFEKGTPEQKVGLKGLKGALSDGNEPLFAPFSENSDKSPGF